jgi:hypothetical protein
MKEHEQQLTYYQLHREEILKKQKEFYKKNKEKLNERSLLYYYKNKHKWYKYHDTLEKTDAQQEIYEIKKLINENNKLDNEIKDLNKKIWRKQAYIRGMKKTKEIKNRVTIEPDATLIIYWND